MQCGQLLQNFSLIHHYRRTNVAFWENALALSCLLLLHSAVLSEFLSVSLTASCFYQSALVSQMLLGSETQLLPSWLTNLPLLWQRW